MASTFFFIAGSCNLFHIQICKMHLCSEAGHCQTARPCQALHNCPPWFRDLNMTYALDRRKRLLFNPLMCKDSSEDSVQIL